MRRAVGIGIAVLAVVAPASASAHPLGNFTTNQLVTASFDQDEARLGVVLDLAEIPTYQLIERHDTDGDGAIAGSEAPPLIAELEREVDAGLTLTAAGRTVPVRPAGAPELSFPPGQAGLSLTRLELSYAAPLPAGARSVEVANDSFADRTGWRAIQVLPGDGTDVESSVPATDPTRGLTVYPKDVLQSPADDRSAEFTVTPGSGQVSAPDGISGAGFTDDRGAGGFAGLLTGGDTHGLMIRSCWPPRSAGARCTPCPRATASRWWPATSPARAASRATPSPWA
jgi:hypothetical protein